MHFEKRILELLDKVIIEQAMFQLIDGTLGLRRQRFEPDPNQVCTLVWPCWIAVLAAFQPRGLLVFAVQLLDLNESHTPIVSPQWNSEWDRSLRPQSVRGWKSSPNQFAMLLGKRMPD